MVAAHYRSHVEFSFEALERRRPAFRADRGLPRPRAAGASTSAVPTGDEVAARRLRRGDGRRPRHAGGGRGRSTRSCARATSCSPTATATTPPRSPRAVLAMLDVLGLDPLDPAWRPATRRRRRRQLATRSTPSSRALLEQRAARPGRQGLGTRGRDPRPAHGRRHRARGHRRTGPNGPSRRRTERLTDGRQLASARARSGSRQRSGPHGRLGRPVSRGLEGKGPTPKAKDRPNHKAHKRGRSAERAAAPAGRTSSPQDQGERASGRRAQLGRRGAARRRAGDRVYVAEGAERDGRLREAFKIAADRGISLLEVTARRARPADRRGGAPGAGGAGPGVRVRPPERPARRAAERGEPPLIVALDSVTDPRNLGAVVRSAAGVRRPRRGDPRAPGGRHDRVRVEDLGRRRRPDPGGAGDQPDPRRSRPTRTPAAWSSASPWTATCRCPTSTSPPARSWSSSAPRARASSRLVSETCDQLVSIPMSLGRGVAQRRRRRLRHPLRGRAPPSTALTQPVPFYGKQAWRLDVGAASVRGSAPPERPRPRGHDQPHVASQRGISCLTKARPPRPRLRPPVRATAAHPPPPPPPRFG